MTRGSHGAWSPSTSTIETEGPRLRTPCAGCHMTLAFCTNQTRLYLSLTTALVGGMMAFAVVPKAEETHHRFHDSDYRHWKQPGSDISCCSDRDCAPVTAELRKGQWFALRQSEWIAVPDERGPGQWLALRQSEWMRSQTRRLFANAIRLLRARTSVIWTGRLFASFRPIPAASPHHRLRVSPWERRVAIAQNSRLCAAWTADMNVFDDLAMARAGFMGPYAWFSALSTAT